MCFGFRRKKSQQQFEALTRAFIELRSDIRDLKEQVKILMSMQDQVSQDIATIKSQVATMASNYTAAAAASQAKALADAKAAWDASDEAAWTKAHGDLTDVINAMTAGQPITPPATAANPSPTPVPAPTADPAPAAPAAGA